MCGEEDMFYSSYYPSYTKALDKSDPICVAMAEQDLARQAWSLAPLGAIFAWFKGRRHPEPALLREEPLFLPEPDQAPVAPKAEKVEAREPVGVG
jgi:hypothetical protein